MCTVVRIRYFARLPIQKGKGFVDHGSYLLLVVGDGFSEFQLSKKGGYVAYGVKGGGCGFGLEYERCHCRWDVTEWVESGKWGGSVYICGSQGII